MFLTFTVLGCILTFGQVLTFADNFLFVCAFVNLLGVYMLLPVIKREMKEYLADRASGRLLELGKEDADKEIPLEEIAGENQLVDPSGRNRVELGVEDEELREGTGATVRGGHGRHEEQLDTDDDGFGRGGTTTPVDPPHGRPRGEHRGRRPGTDD